MTNDELKAAVTEQAQAIIEKWERPIILDLNITAVVALIGTVQVALRHPNARQSPTMMCAEKIIVDVIDQIDPSHGDLWKFLNMGFNRTFDE